MPTARHLLAASLSLLAATACAQTHYAGSEPTTRMAKVSTGLPSTLKPARCAIRPWSARCRTWPNSPCRGTVKLCMPPAKSKGVVQAWRIEANGELTDLNQVSSLGPGRSICR